MTDQNDNDWLEDFVRNNREDFDAHEPSPELWEKIAPRPKPARPLWTRWAAAAAVVALIALAWFKPWQTDTNTSMTAEAVEAPAAKQEQANSNGAIPELIEAEAYYAMQVEARFEELRALPEWQADLEAELQYDMAELDTAYVQLKADLYDDLVNQEIIEVML